MAPDAIAFLETDQKIWTARARIARRQIETSQAELAECDRELDAIEGQLAAARLQAAAEHTLTGATT